MKPIRILLSAAIPLICIVGAVLLYHIGSPVPCVFKMLTHLDCPGCGSGRAAAALLHLDFATAFYYNPLFVLALPIILYACAKYYILLVTGKDVLPLKISTPIGMAILIVIVAFGILRNIL